jgi:hypothetical protein
MAADERSEEDAAERPWTEAQWEAMFRRSDARSAKFGELLETFMDDPDAEQKIAREMGWSHLAGEESEEADPEFEAWKREVIEAAIEAVESGTDVSEEDDDWEDDFDGIDADADADSDADADEESADEEDEHEPLGRRSRKLREIEAYRLAYDTGLLVHRLLQPYMAQIEDEFADEATERLVNAYSHSLRAAPKIAGGHGMGYEDDAICGNIVYNRIALDSVQTTEAELTWLRDHGKLPTGVAAQCLTPLGQVRAALEARIAELRAKVWWS